MKPPIHRRRRILLHFFIGIGLPSLLLAYLAFRGVQNDLALAGKERIDEHQAIAQQIINELDDQISAVEGACLEALARLPDSQPEADERQAVEPQGIRQEFVEEVFFFDSGGQLQFPFTKLLFLAGRRTGSPVAQPPSSALSSGQDYEFKEQS